MRDPGNEVELSTEPLITEPGYSLFVMGRRREGEKGGEGRGGEIVHPIRKVVDSLRRRRKLAPVTCVYLRVNFRLQRRQHDCLP